VARAGDHETALRSADRVFVTAHPAERAAAVALRAGEAALESYLDGARAAGPSHLVGPPTDGPLEPGSQRSADGQDGDDPATAPAPGGPTTAPAPHAPEPAALDALRRLFTRHLRERLPDDADGTLYAAVTAATVVAALDLALTEWWAAGGRADGAAACRERFRAVAPLLHAEP